jgi:hypothetical protein
MRWILRGLRKCWRMSTRNNACVGGDVYCDTSFLNRIHVVYAPNCRESTTSSTFSSYGSRAEHRLFHDTSMNPALAQERFSGDITQLEANVYAEDRARGSVSCRELGPPATNRALLSSTSPIIATAIAQLPAVHLRFLHLHLHLPFSLPCIFLHTRHFGLRHSSAKWLP